MLGRTLDAQAEQLVVCDISPDLAVAALDPLLDLGESGTLPGARRKPPPGSGIRVGFGSTN